VRRLSVLRVALPLLLVGLIAAIWIAVRSRPPRSLVPADTSTEEGARMEGFRFTDIVGGRRRLFVQAKVGRVDDSGAFSVEEVERVEIDREKQTPLVLSAARGAGSGPQGRRVLRLEGGVTVTDNDLGATLLIPTVEVDQVAGVVRSLGGVTMSGERGNGRASAIVYSLKGEPTEILTLVFDGVGGEHVEANRTLVASASNTATLEGAVRARQAGMDFAAERAVLTRGASGKLESLEAGPNVTGHAQSIAGGTGAFAAQEVRAAWDVAGTITSLDLMGVARVDHARGTLAGDAIHAAAKAGGAGFALDASGNVVATGELRDGPGRLFCDALTATIDAHGNLHDGRATGRPRFNAVTSWGDAATIEFAAPEGGSGTVTLRADGEQRAHLANGRTRLAADSIVSDPEGAHLVASGRVDSTLLPPPAGSKEPASTPMFSAGDAVHFVSSTLDSFEQGKRLVFGGDVRGWQGERMLSSDTVEMLQDGDTLTARGHVTTRLPRQAERAAGEADYVQVTSDQLVYRGAAHTAVYDGSVRVRQAEGWLEAPRVTALMASEGSGLKEARAEGGVKFEYRAPGASGIPKTSTGEGDRAVYDTEARIVRIFGDTRPATVRGSGPDAGTTVGRVLRYQLDTGGLEVESGERDRATIKTPKN